MQEQRILTLALISAEKLMKKQSIYQEMYGEQSIIFILELLFQCLYKKDTEVQTDRSTVIFI